MLRHYFRRSRRSLPSCFSRPLIRYQGVGQWSAIGSVHRLSQLFCPCRDHHRRSSLIHTATTVLTLFVCVAASPKIQSAGAAPSNRALQANLATLQQVGRHATGHESAVAAWKVVKSADASQLPTILASMQEDNPLADNWVRAAVDAIAERTLAAGRSLPQAELEAYLRNLDYAPRSRRLAFEWLTKIDRSAHQRWVSTFLNDPSLELRREAIAALLKQADAAIDAGDTTLAIATYRKAFQYARDIDQIEQAATALRDLDQEVDLTGHFGFITRWQLIGPFDNTDTTGFDKAYPPEIEIDLAAEYAGKGQTVGWQAAVTDDEYGLVDLNEQLGKHQGAAAYAVAFFHADSAQAIELRLGCINANKVWLNGDLVMANHVYHAGRGIDQYVGQGKLQPGRNTILLKICQNEQTESWAQDWEFQLRVCDALGTAVTSSEQP